MRGCEKKNLMQGLNILLICFAPPLPPHTHACTHLAVLGGQLTHQHAEVLRVPLPVLTAEVLQQADGFVQTVEDAHHPRVRRKKMAGARGNKGH